MPTLKEYAPTLCLLAVIVLPCACSRQQKPTDFPAVYPCMITVTQDAKPLPGATVILVPETVLEKGWVISGGTDSRGIARMFTHGKYEGAPGGKYKVLISKQEHENAEPPKMPMSASDFRPPVPVYDTVDARYKTVKTTPFEIEVNNGKTTASFDVGKAVRKTIPKI